MTDHGDPLLQGQRPDEVAIDYIKAPDFRTVWVDGAIGSPTPAGAIHVAFYAERPAIPRRQVHRINLEKKELGPALPEKTIGRHSIIREMSIDILISLDAAEKLAQFFSEQAKLLKKMQEQTSHE